MDFELSDEHKQLCAAVADLCGRFDSAYWLEKDRSGDFPEEFYRAVAEAGWLGIAMPEEYGGSGLGITAAALMMNTITASGGGMSAASSVHMNIFGLNPVVVFGNEAQKQRALPPLIRGEQKACFGVTEPDAGLNTTKLKTRAERHGDHYRVHGRKVWISTAQVADNILLLARTTPADQVRKPTDGLSLFYTKLDRNYVDVREIDKMGRAAVDSNELLFDGLPVPVEDRIGEEGKGFGYILHGMNPERILVAMEAVGIGQVALQRASQYAKERVVFDRPIGKNQSVQHPLARCWVELEAARLMAMRAGALYDAGKPCGSEANAAKYLSAEAAIRTCQVAMLTHGGFGYAKEFHIERYMREALLLRLAPITPQLILSNIAEKVLGMPKSY